MQFRLTYSAKGYEWEVINRLGDHFAPMAKVNIEGITEPSGTPLFDQIQRFFRKVYRRALLYLNSRS